MADLKGYGASPVECPSCGTTFTGTFTDPYAETETRCPGGHLVRATWKGWTGQPVIRDSVQETAEPSPCRCETVTAALSAWTVNPCSLSHSPRSGTVSAS